MNVATEAKDRFCRLAAAGLTMTIFFYVAINLMMVMGLAPVVGVPHPWRGSCNPQAAPLDGALRPRAWTHSSVGRAADS